MTSTPEITNLVAAMNNVADYFDEKKDAIDTAVAHAMSVAPLIARHFFIDQVNGNDAATGAAGAPIKTIDAALARTPRLGECRITLLGDYTLDSMITVNAARLVLQAAQGRAVQPVIRPEYFGAPLTMGCFYSAIQFDVVLYDVGIVMPADIVGDPAPAYTWFTGLFFNWGQGASTNVFMQSCNVTFEAGCNRPHLFQHLGHTFFRTQSCTFPAAIAGRLFSGIGGVGVDPSTPAIRRDVNTNTNWI